MTSRQKSRALPLTRSAASSGPNAHVVPSGAVSSTRNSSAGGVRSCTAKAKSRVRTPSRAMCRNRAVGVRPTSSASATSCACAQVSIMRAVAIDAGLMSGPYHGSFRPAGTAASAACSSALPARQRRSSSVGSRRASSWAPSSTKFSPAANARCRSASNSSGVRAAISDFSSVHSR
ncbi:hypothetical protein BJF85_09535 [Saccharomonospora sp. CUA-673]|nr:hypothetical protein BJF85_09535 [Saccharomonospora sp. CUA-673]